MRRFIKNYLLIISTIFLYACADQIVSECDTEANSNNLFRANLSSIQEYVFSPNCAVSGCHIGPNAAQGLELSPDLSFQNLVGVASNQSGLLRVQAGNSDQSWLIKKLNANGTSVMPPSGKLVQSLIDSIAVWIDNGALDN
jgi:hypothetical protein